MLALNLNETSISAIFTRLRGNVAEARETRGAAAEVTQPVPKGLDRQCFTLVAIICSESAMQPLMPQVILAPQALLRVETWCALQHGLPDNAYVKHNATGWNSEGVLVEIITILGMILQPFLQEYQPVLFLDAAPVHLAAAVIPRPRRRPSGSRSSRLVSLGCCSLSPRVASCCCSGGCGEPSRSA